MQPISRVLVEPLPHFGMLVRSVVIENQMDLLTRRNSFVDLTEKMQKLLMPVTWLALRDNGAFQNVQGGKRVVVPCRR